MNYVSVGNSGLKISEITLGCMSFGERTGAAGFAQHDWTLSEQDSRPLIRAALEAGITTFDTADVYSQGSSERIVGKALADFTTRDQVVIATKVYGRMGDGPNDEGLSRAHIMNAIDASLRRLGTDYVDLYQIHRFDQHTPIEETMQALHDVVRAGKARYLGASSMWAWQFAELQHAADLGGWTRFVSMQDQYSLLMREEEREMHPYCVNQGVGVLPWSPLARGRLTRDPAETTTRSDSDRVLGAMLSKADESDNAIIEAVRRIAERRGISRAQVALAWVRQQPAVSSPIVGVTKQRHLDDAIASGDVTLDQAELDELTTLYVAREPSGF